MSTLDFVKLPSLLCPQGKGSELLALSTINFLLNSCGGDAFSKDGELHWEPSRTPSSFPANHGIPSSQLSIPRFLVSNLQTSTVKGTEIMSQTTLLASVPALLALLGHLLQTKHGHEVVKHIDSH